MDIFIGIASVIFGFILGFNVRGAIFSSLDWNLLKWDSEIFAYRVAPKGSPIKKNDKVFMALRIPTSDFIKKSDYSAQHKK